MSQGTLHWAVMQTCQCLTSMKSEIIKFPNAPRDYEENAQGFAQRCGFPGVVGAIDGTHIAIPAPKSDNRASYTNRKGFASIQLQVICDSSLRFLDTYTGWPGSVHDARVYRNSPIFHEIMNLDEEFHVIGDSAYPLSTTMMVPYLDNGHLDPIQKKYNRAHSSTRVDVERSIGSLKIKFRRLKYLDMYLHESIPVVITACCVLHNLILINELNEEEYETEEELPHEPHEGVVNVIGEEKRRRIADML